MKETELTEWFPKNIKPLREGVYQTMFSREGYFKMLGFSFWNGSVWEGQFSDVHKAMNLRDMNGIQEKEWRGLKEPA